MRRLFPVLLLLPLTGCFSPLQQLKERNPAANDFNSSLASEYQAYAESESEQGRSFSAEHYASKGMKALKGEAVLPEPLDTSLKPEQQRSLAAAREKLMALLTDDMKRVAPQKLARAELLFDCWQHELSRALNEDLAPCADEFANDINELQEVADSLKYGAETTHIITFASHRASLDETALAEIKNIAEGARKAGNYGINLNAYIGRHAAQQHLSKARLEAVRRALVKDGVPSRRIRIQKHGGAKIVILTHDGAPDPKKVTVTIKTRHRPEE